MVNCQWNFRINIHNSPLTIHKKLNRITERTSEQFACRSSKLATTKDEQRYIVDNIKTVNGRNSNTAINGRSQRIQHR